MEKADNYDELLEFCENKNDIDPAELEWGNAKDARRFDNIQNLMWVYESIVATIDEAMDVGDDKKKAHRAKKGVETLITSVRKIKKESNEIIEQEQQVISETNAVFDDIENYCPSTFNKSHAISFALLAYRTAYLKCHYPEEWKEAVECDADDTDF